MKRFRKGELVIIKNKRVTLKDVAREAGVGLGTASRVLNKNPSVKEKARKAVEDAIERLKYKPNAIARSLKTMSTRTIGVIISDISNPFYPEVVRGIEDISNIYGYNIFLSNTDKDALRISQSIEVFREKKVDGILFIRNSGQNFRTEQLLELDIPVVTICTRDIDDNFPSVTIDNEKAARMAVEYLIKLGHKDIAILTGDSDLHGTSGPRLTGFLNVLKENKLPVKKNWILKGEFNYKKSYEIVKELLGQKKLPTAIFAASDMMALACARAILESGLKVPDDISVIGLDGIEYTEYFYPSITTVVQHRYDMGAVGMRILTKLLNNEEIEQRHMQIECELIERESCKKI